LGGGFQFLEQVEELADADLDPDINRYFNKTFDVLQILCFLTVSVSMVSSFSKAILLMVF